MAVLQGGKIRESENGKNPAIPVQGFLPCPAVEEFQLSVRCSFLRRYKAFNLPIWLCCWKKKLIVYKLQIFLKLEL